MPIAPRPISTKNHPSNTPKKSNAREDAKRNREQEYLNPKYSDIHSEARSMGVQFHQSSMPLTKIMSDEVKLPFPEAEFLTCEENYEPMFDEPFQNEPIQNKFIQNEPAVAADENVTTPVEPLFGSGCPVELMINEPRLKPRTTSTTTTTQHKKQSKSSSSKTKTTTTTTHTLPSGKKIVTNHSKSSSENVNVPVSENTTRTSKRGKTVSKKTRPVRKQNKEINRERRLAAFTEFMDMMDHFAESSSESEEDSEEDAKEGAEESADDAAFDFQHEDENSMEAISETISKMTQKKNKIKNSLEQSKESVELLKSTKHEEEQAFVKLTEEQTRAKRKLDEAQEQWNSISAKCYEKKIRVVELENEITENEQKIHSSRKDKRKLKKTTINTGRDLIDQLLNPFKTRRSPKEPRQTVSSKRPRYTTDKEEEEEEETKNLKGSKGLKSCKISMKHTKERTGYGRLSSSEETSENSTSSSGFTSEYSSSSSSSSELSETSESSEEPTGSKRESSYFAKRNVPESTDFNLINAIRGNGDMPMSLQNLSEQDLAYALEKADSKLIMELAKHIPESEEKLRMTGILLNDSTCTHCGNFDRTFWDGRRAAGYICPDCRCGKCNNIRTQCRCGVFFTKTALTLPVGKYNKRGAIGDKRMKKWTVLFQDENVEETLVDKFNRMIDTPSDHPDYYGRNGILNSYKRWLRRYIVHCFTVKRLREFIYNLCSLNAYVEKNKGHNPSCRPDHCVICSCRHIYENENRVPGSMSTTGNGTSHRCCTACKNILSTSTRDTFSWCLLGYTQFSDEKKKYGRR